MRAPAQAGEVMALVPEHNLPSLVHAHHVVPRVAPGHGVDGSAEEREGRLQGSARWACSLALPLSTGPGQFEARSEPISFPIKGSQDYGEDGPKCI